MQPVPTRLDGPLLLQPEVFGDDRGFFLECYRASTLAALGVGDEFVQDNHSRSRRGVVRGMHFAVGSGAAAKLVRCPRGAILDVLVDVRRGSPTFGEWESFELDDRSLRLLYVPSGFAHGFCALDELNDVIYKQTAYYDPSREGGIAWNDPDVGIAWPSDIDFQVSDRDSVAPRLADVADTLPFTWSSGDR